MDEPDATCLGACAGVSRCGGCDGSAICAADALDQPDGAAWYLGDMPARVATQLIPVLDEVVVRPMVAANPWMEARLRLA